MLKATPGPWGTATGDSVVKIFGGNQYIAVTASKAYWQRHDETDVANATLIAASPDLYAALEAARPVVMAMTSTEWAGVGYFGSWQEADDSLRTIKSNIEAALRKANPEYGVGPEK